MTDQEASAMEIEHQIVEEQEEEEDPFLQFIEYAKTILLTSVSDSYDGEAGDEAWRGPGWSWMASRVLKTCIAYSSGVTSAILLSELSQAWNEQNRGGASKKQAECIRQLQKKHKRARLPNTVTIDSVYEKKFLSKNSVIEAVIVDAFVLPGTTTYMLTLGDFWSSNTIDLYLHRRFYDLANPNNGILKKGRGIFLTGCYLRTNAGASGHSRLLPTEYLVILLDEDQDDDAMLLGAQFCSDSFSSITLDAAKEGVFYSLYARIEAVGSLEIQGMHGSLQRKEISLVDNDGFRLKFLLWGDQVLLANLFSVGSMLALDRPFISSSVDCALETCEEICLEYGSATQLYLVPLVQHVEQVSVAVTQNRCQGSRLFAGSDSSQGHLISQVNLPCNSQGSIDFSHYPFRSFVVDLRDRMTGISLYGIVAEIKGNKGHTFSLRIEDTSGSIWAKLHLVKYWSLGRLGVGHTVYISGLSCSMTAGKGLELLWVENELGASFINISCLPAFLNSSCLHKLSKLSDLNIHTSGTHICRIWLDQIGHVDTRYSHVRCGHFVHSASGGDFECNFCHSSCSNEVRRTFYLKISLADENGKILAWCTGPPAVELLQISPDEFQELPEEEQIMYPSSLEHERFTVAIVNCRNNSSELEDDIVGWEVTRAMKYA